MIAPERVWQTGMLALTNRRELELPMGRVAPKKSQPHPLPVQELRVRRFAA